MQFLRTWIGLLLKGDSYLGRGVRVTGLAVTLGATLFLQEKVKVLIEFPWDGVLAGDLPFGLTLSSLLAAEYAVVTAGMAWPLSRGPKLVVGAVPEEDNRYRLFRLRVRNEGRGIAEPRVNVRDIVLADGSSPVSRPSLPFELRWSHLERNERPKLVKGSGGATADVVFVDLTRSDKKFRLTFKFGGMTFAPDIDTDQTMYVHLVVVMDGHKSIDRWLAFELDRSVPIQCRVSAQKPPRRIAAPGHAVTSAGPLAKE
jgi:hypothetical protein